MARGADWGALTMLQTLLLLSLSLQLMDVALGQESCLEQREALKTLRQLQKLLTEHETSNQRGLKTLNRRLTRLRDLLTKGDPAESCPRVKPPRHGRILGGKTKAGHEIHVACDPGFQLLGSETRTCLANRTWSGEPAACAEPSPATNSSSLRPAKCSSLPGGQRCTCDPGYLIQPGALCQDVDECSLFQSRRAGSRICVHECVNTPGSFRCVCPQGYVPEPEQNSCKDIDECLAEQPPCAGPEKCVNLFGGFVCVDPECPRPRQNTSYIKTSARKCERTPCPMGSSSCTDAPHSISFHYLALQSQLPVPRVLFTMSAQKSSGSSQRFSIVRGRSQRGLLVRPAGGHRGELVLERSLTGPAELQLDVEMAEMSPHGVLGRHVFSLTIFVSQYPF
ncbi:fibulin-7-like [Spea bombifrons]|uniref:fibulin-7-like n=1 Tax=Spea bombifrons TaxID=233779 RepID=UPI00234A8A84|nr:fibulin-7-like [Spea bombifrons]